METCIVEECDREVYNKKRQLCEGHFGRFRKGLPLEGPMGSLRAKAKEKVECLHEGCDRLENSRGMCVTHAWQYRQHGVTWDIGTLTDNSITLASGFSTARWCPKCLSEKDWRQFYLEQNMCTECWRRYLSHLAKDKPKKRGKSLRSIRRMIDEQIEQSE